MFGTVRGRVALVAAGLGGAFCIVQAAHPTAWATSPRVMAAASVNSSGASAGSSVGSPVGASLRATPDAVKPLQVPAPGSVALAGLGLAFMMRRTRAKVG